MSDSLKSIPKHRRTLKGVVVGASKDKTVSVRVERVFRHPKFQRVIRRSKKFLVHDARSLGKEGDVVLIEESRPISKRKRWRLIEILQKSERSEENI